MTYRKTWFSYVLWVLYTILCVLLLVYVSEAWTYYFAGVPYSKNFPDSIAAPLAGLSDNILLVVGLMIIPFTAVLYWIIRTISRRIMQKCTWKKSAMIRVECITVLGIMAVGILLRIACARFDISMISDGVFYNAHVQGAEYYELARVTASGSATSFLRYDAAELYVLCLSVVLSFLGNKIASAIILQAFLQIAGMGLAYAVTRKSAGRLPACAVLLYLACSPCCLEMLTWFSPEWLFFDLYMIGMLIVVSFVKDYCGNQFHRSVSIAGAVAVGAVIGILACVDLTAVTLLLIMAAVVIGKKYRQEDMAVYNAKGVSAAVIIVTLLSSVLGWLGLVAMTAYGSDISLSSAIEKWCEPYLKYTYNVGIGAEYPYLYDIYLIGVLVIPASFLIFEFFRSGKEQNYMLWILICFFVAPTPMAGIGVQGFGLWSLYVWSVLAGLGLQNCIFGSKAKVMQAVIEEINSAAEEAEESEGEAESIADIEGRKEETAEEVETVAKEAVPKQKPRFIENPLPLPKKHVKKEMDYQYPVEEKDMKYDVEVPEDDDFDIL